MTNKDHRSSNATAHSSSASGTNVDALIPVIPFGQVQGTEASLRRAGGLVSEQLDLVRVSLGGQLCRKLSKAELFSVVCSDSTL